jgi:putative hydrolase of the HAD superfamily
MNNICAILLDLGDTIMIEESEVKDNTLTTLKADLVIGMDYVIRKLSGDGIKLGLVADTKPGTYKNVLIHHRLYNLFDIFAISEELGVEKPNPEIFTFALNKLGIQPIDYGRVLMVGNNLHRDIRGANNLGLTSVWFHWNDRYRTIPVDDSEIPKYIVHSVDELLNLISTINIQNSG